MVGMAVMEYNAQTTIAMGGFVRMGTVGHTLLVVSRNTQKMMPAMARAYNRSGLVRNFGCAVRSACLPVECPDRFTVASLVVQAWAHFGTHENPCNSERKTRPQCCAGLAPK